MVVDFDLFLEAQDWQAADSNSAVFSVVMLSDTGEQATHLTISESSASVGVKVGPAAHGRKLATDRWVHVQYDVTPDVRVRADIDGEVHDVAMRAVSRSGNERTLLMLGVNGFNDPTPEFRVYVDNVTVDFP